MPLQVYAIEVDIRETMSDLLAHAGEALTLDLTNHRVTVLGDRQMDSQDTLQDQCGTRTGHVQVQFVIRSDEEGGVLDIVDVLKSSEEEVNEEEVAKEDAPPERSKPTRWVVSTEFRGIQKALKMPRDPRQWTAAHVRVWLAWARQHFPEVAPHHHHHGNFDGAQMMTLTPSQLLQHRVLLTHAGDRPGDSLFVTHRDLLKQTGAAAVCELPPAPQHSVHQQTSQATSRSEKIQRSSLTSATGVTASVPQPIQLWQFLLELLTEPKLVKVISWWGTGISGEFRLHQPEAVAALWGHRKGRPNMTYDKLSRALRYYYEGDMIAKVAGKKFVYRFVLDLKVVVGYSAAELKAQVLKVTMGAWGSDFAALDFNFASDAPVVCPLCPKSFTVTQDCKFLLQHLLEAHHLIIGEVEQVADLRQYILYWGKLHHLKLQDYCVVFSTSSEPGVPAVDSSPANTYYLLCDKLPEDFKLRRSLMQMKLKHVVEQKEKERQDVNFSRQCIYCSEIVTGGVTNCFQHLTHQHSFSLGNPDNIVFGAQLLDILHEKLRNLQCLCCEKIFKTHKMLREHMRKQQHRCLNPKNKVYDKFYLRNYLRPGMPWEETKRNLDEESDTESLSEDGGHAVKFQEEPEWTDWLEVNIHPTTCLFCSFTTTKVPAGLFSHMKVHHNFDFQQITHNFSFYQKVKVVNYIRCCMLELQCLQCQSVFASYEALQEHISDYTHCRLPNPLVWDLPQYHIPVCDNDGLLQHLEDGEMDEPQGSLTSVADQVVYPEDLQPLNDSILHNSSLREELTQTEDKEVDLVVTCLFCCYTVPGEHAHLLMYAHMSTLHCFDFPEVVSGLSYYTQVKLINYMRRKTAQKECHVCSQVFQDRGALEEHRVLASHTSLPPSHLFQDQSWLKPILEGDGLLQRLREDGDSDDEDPSVPDSSREEVMFGEDVELPQLTSQLQAITLELLKNDDS